MRKEVNVENLNEVVSILKINAAYYSHKSRYDNFNCIIKIPNFQQLRDQVMSEESKRIVKK